MLTTTVLSCRHAFRARDGSLADADVQEESSSFTVSYFRSTSRSSPASSIGNGKTIVELCSAAISFSVCR